MLSAGNGPCDLFPIVLSSGGHFSTKDCSPIDAYLQIAHSHHHALIACKDMDSIFILLLFHSASDSAQTPCRSPGHSESKKKLPELTRDFWLEHCVTDSDGEKKPSTLRSPPYRKVDSLEPNR